MEILSAEEKERYARHLVLQDVEEAGQLRLKEAKVLVVGCGGLGSPILLYLAAAGVGTLGIVDNDVVSVSNLQRQVLYSTADIGIAKTEIAARKLKVLNPYCRIVPYSYRLTAENAIDLIEKYDVVVDATDNLLSRYVINDACVACGKPFVHGSICEFNGQITVFNYKGGPTYRDLFEYHDEVPKFSQPLGVVGSLTGVVGSIQATETLKIILNKGDVLSGRLLLIDLLNSNFQLISI